MGTLEVESLTPLIKEASWGLFPREFVPMVINKEGSFVGWTSGWEGLSIRDAFIFSDQLEKPLLLQRKDIYESTAWGINDNNEVVGSIRYCDEKEEHTFYLSGDTCLALPSYGQKCKKIEKLHINNNGLIVEHYRLNSGDTETAILRRFPASLQQPFTFEKVPFSKEARMYTSLSPRSINNRDELLFDQFHASSKNYEAFPIIWKSGETRSILEDKNIAICESVFLTDEGDAGGIEHRSYFGPATSWYAENGVYHKLDSWNARHVRVKGMFQDMLIANGQNKDALSDNVFFFETPESRARPLSDLLPGEYRGLFDHVHCVSNTTMIVSGAYHLNTFWRIRANAT